MNERDIFGSRRPHNFWASVLSLIGHLVGTAVIFVSLITLGWLISFIMHFLHAIHQFPGEILWLFTRIELYLTYVDIGLCAIFIFAGARRFYRDVLET
jgi:uncharacterized BrkB/YihY/UPF0761 family membrane protein